MASTSGCRQWWSLLSTGGSSPTIDNHCFRLYTHHSALLFLLLSVLVLGHSYFTDVIDCVSGDSHIPWGVLDAVCYVQGTFSIASAWQKQVGHEVPYPGIENFQANEERVHHHYYKWVGWTLLVQAILFYLPGHFWRSVERGRISTILKQLDRRNQAPPSAFGIDHHRPLQPTGATVTEPDPSLSFLTISRRWENLAILIAFMFFELLNLVLLLAQALLINELLNRQFIVYGWLALFSGAQPDIRTRLFPDRAKCSLLRFTSSGDIQRTDSTCVLSSNFLYAQIYMLIWVWFHFLLLVSLVSLVARILTLSWPYARALRASELPLLGPGPSEETRKLAERLPLGSWFMVNLVGKNLDRDQFSAWLKQLAGQLNSEGYLGPLQVKANGNGAA